MRPGTSFGLLNNPKIICFTMSLAAFFNSLSLLLGYLCWAYHWCCGCWHPRTHTESCPRGENHLWRTTSHHHNWGNWEWAACVEEWAPCPWMCIYYDPLEGIWAAGRDLIRWILKSLSTLGFGVPWNLPLYDLRSSPLTTAKLSSYFPKFYLHLVLVVFFAFPQGPGLSTYSWGNEGRWFPGLQ